MAGTRSSTRLAGHQKSSPTQPKESPDATTGSKRKADAGLSPTAKRGCKLPDNKEQKTIEDTMDVETKTDKAEKDTKNGDSPKLTPEIREIEKPDEPKEQEKQGDFERDTKGDESAKSKPLENGSQETGQTPKNDDDEAKPKTGDKGDEVTDQDTSKMDDTGKIEPNETPQSQSKQQDQPATNSDTAVEPHARDENTPSSILEKGVIYFFIRGRVGIDNPHHVDDIARSYIILRPIPHGAKLGQGPIGDADGKCRLLALPKKVLPLSGKDKFMTFVEKSKTSFKELRDDFMSGSDYNTATVGVRHTPPVAPVAEGVYAMTTTGRESHLAYMITIPQKLSEVQKDIGIREQGSFVTSAKNPEYAGPANTNLPQGPGFPKEVLDEFRGLRWAPLQPKLLDYENAQFLLIGESDGLEKALQPQSGDEKQHDPKEELEKLEGEDEIRIKHLKGDDTVFADLGISKKEYPQVPSTWNN